MVSESVEDANLAQAASRRWLSNLHRDPVSLPDSHVRSTAAAAALMTCSAHRGGEVSPVESPRLAIQVQYCASPQTVRARVSNYYNNYSSERPSRAFGRPNLTPSRSQGQIGVSRAAGIYSREIGSSMSWGKYFGIGDNISGYPSARNSDEQPLQKIPTSPLDSMFVGMASFKHDVGVVGEKTESVIDLVGTVLFVSKTRKQREGGAGSHSPAPTVPSSITSLDSEDTLGSASRWATFQNEMKCAYHPSRSAYVNQQMLFFTSAGVAYRSTVTVKSGSFGELRRRCQQASPISFSMMSFDVLSAAACLRVVLNRYTAQTSKIYSWDLVMWHMFSMQHGAVWWKMTTELNSTR